MKNADAALVVHSDFFKNKTPYPITRIWLHLQPHLDEIVALWIIVVFGDKLFPNVSDCNIEIVDPAKVDKTFGELLREGILVIGFGGGPFDEHPQAGIGRLEGECAATLVAEYLGIRNDPRLKNLLGYVLEKDSHATAGQFSLASMVKTLMRYPPERTDPKECTELVMDWVFQALRGIYRQSKAYHACAGDFERCHIHDDVDIDGAMLAVTTIRSDSCEAQKWVRATTRARIVIVVGSTGNAQIFFDQRAMRERIIPDFQERFGMRDPLGLVKSIARAVRIAERAANGLPALPAADRTLTEDGCSEGSDCWYFEARMFMMLNGSLTNPKQPTRLGMEKLHEVVVNAIREYVQYLRRSRPRIASKR